MRYKTRSIVWAGLLLLGMGANSVAAQDQGTSEQFGANPELPEPEKFLVPPMKISRPTSWDGELPTAPDGYVVTAIADDLLIPRQMLALPNGDILIAEGKGGGAPVLRPKDFVAGFIKGLGKSKKPSGNRITLLRDQDGDGMPDLRTIFIDDLNAPYGLAMINNEIFVANTDALLAFPYTQGVTEITDPPRFVTELPAGEVNHHWTKAMTASLDGTRLYVGIGSNSNIGEKTMAVEQDRAVVWEVDPTTGMHRQFVTGIRNPSALATNPKTGDIFAAVNERDEIGADLVPDYLTKLTHGEFYGWPWSYWGDNIDVRAKPENPEMVAKARAPDFSLGSHRAPLGLVFSNAENFGPEYSNGVFVGQHGSWNRPTVVGYNVVYVPFVDGKPSGEPVEFLGGFLGSDGKARGRPVGVAFDGTGALLVADDLSNTVWRVSYEAGN